MDKTEQFISIQSVENLEEKHVVLDKSINITEENLMESYWNQ